ncbi:MAG: hypothetical protein ACRDL6_03655 [Solirubrobacterales bacterium]
MEAQTGIQRGGNHRPAVPPPGTRSSDEIRRDIVQQRQQLSRSVDMLRTRWGEMTDLRRQAREHRTELIAGAAAVGFLVGGAIALSRRRR